MSTFKPLFTWIHLSDIHVGHGDAKHAADQKLVLNELKNDIRGAAARDLPPPDAIFVTGDLAFSGSTLAKDEYKRVNAWLSQIATSVSLSFDRVFIVPGNHDVQRNVEENDPSVAVMLKKLRSGELKVDNVLADKGRSLLLRQRLSNYLKFAKEFAPANYLPKQRRADLYWSHKHKVPSELTFQLVGINTALLAAKEEDEYGDLRRLQGGKKQLADALSSGMGESQQELTILLSHHPFNWLRDGAEVTAFAKKYAHIHLCGHLHNAETSRMLSGSGQEIITITAGAVHEDARDDTTTYRHGYNFASVWERNDGQRMLRVWPRGWSKNFDFRVDQDSIPAIDENGKLYREAYVDHELRLKTSTPNETNQHVQPIRRRPHEVFPDLLNRHEQEDALVEALVAHRSEKSKRPFVCVVHGGEFECHPSYLARLIRSLPEILSAWHPLGAKSIPVEEFDLDLPLNRKTKSEYERTIWLRLRKVTHSSKPVSEEQIINFFASHKLPIIIKCSLSTGDLKRASLDSIDWFLKFWEKWPEISNLLFLVVISFKYHRTTWKHPVRKWFRSRFNKQIRQYLDRLDFSEYKDIYGKVLPELTPIHRTDAEALIRHEQVSSYSCLDDQDIRTLYENQTLCTPDGSIPMETLLDRLIAICEEKRVHNSRRI